MTSPDSAQDPGDSALIWLLAAAGALALPIVLGWAIAPLLAEWPPAWKSPRVAIAVLGSCGVATVSVTVEAARAFALPLGDGTLVALALLWVATVPWGLAIGLARLPFLATALAEGRADPRHADKIRAAIRARTITDATARTATNLPPAVVGVVADQDRRDVLARWRDRRAQQRSTPLWPVAKGVLALPERPPRLICVGASGSGKTTALIALVAAALSAGWRVAVLDLKGSRDDADRYLNLAGRMQARAVWWRGGHLGTSPYDGWRGDTAACVKKASALLPHDGPSHYTQRATAAMLAVGSAGPWTSVADLLQRLHSPSRYVTDQAALAALTARKDGRTVAAAVAADLHAALGALGDSIDGGQGSWSWDDDSTTAWDFAMVTADVGADRGNAAAVALMIADLDTYRSSRRGHAGALARPTLVIIDEAGALLDSDLAPPDLPHLSEQLRSANIGLVLAAQSVESLGPAGPRLMNSGCDLLVGRMPDPDQIVRLAGTQRVAEIAHQGNRAGATRTGRTAAREQHTHRLDPDHVRDARTGLFALLETGQSPRWVAIRSEVNGT